MKDKKVKKWHKLKIPSEVMASAGIQDEVVQVSVEYGKITIEKLTDEDIESYACDNDCKGCPCYKRCKRREK